MNSETKIFQLPEVRVVEASAGSGKTYALAKRYIQLLLLSPSIVTAIPFRHILAITFTNKAAFEMKARILEMIKKIALNRLPEHELNEIISPIGVSPKEASQKAFAVMTQLIGHYNFFQVQTIDKFINSLLAGCAFKIGLTANFRIKTNAPDYLQYSLDRLLDRAATDKDVRRSFEQFLHQYVYMENRTGWFPKDDIVDIIRILFEQHNTYGRRLLMSPVTAEDVVKRKRHILAQMKALYEILPAGIHATFHKNFEKFLANHDKGFDIDKVSAYFCREEIPVKKGMEVSGEVIELWTRINADLRKLCEEEASSLFNPYIDIYQQILRGFDELSAKDDVLFLQQLNQRAASLFDEDRVTVEELYYRLATRFRHYLVDEFQDTSRLQWHNLETMVEEALSTGGSLFYVGDRKQAIYGFRGGDVKLFDDIKTRFSPFNVQIEALVQNWRSEKAIVEFNNSLFSISNLHRFLHEKLSWEEEKKDDCIVEFHEKELQLLERVFKGAQQAFQPGNTQGYVQVERADIDDKKEREEWTAERIISLLKELKLRFSYKDIAILVRNNAHVEDLTQKLLEAGIPVESERTSNIREQSIIQELVSFLTFLNSPIDNIAFANVLTGEMFLKAAGFKAEEMHSFIFSLRERLKGEKDCYLYVEFRKAYPEVWEKLMEPFFKNVGHYPLYELVVSIYHRWDSLKLFAHAQGFLMCFLELLKSKEDDYGDINAFLEYFSLLEGDDLFVRLEDSDAVRILTVHKSKGLEFPVVILPFLNMDIQVCASSADKAQAYVLEENDDSVELLRLKDKYYKFSDNLYQIYRKHYIEAFMSELNNVYVAVTRPQKELYVIIPKKVKNCFNLVNLLIPEDLSIVGDKVSYTLKPKTDKSVLRLGLSQYHDWLQYLREEFLDPDVLRNQHERLRGEILHYCLEQIKTIDPTQIKQAIELAVLTAQIRFPTVENWDDYSKKLNDVLTHPDIQPFFVSDKTVVYNERALVDRHGVTKIPDRILVSDKEVWIVDFKSSYDDQGRAEAQVKEYKTVIAELYPKHKISGFLIYFDSLTVKKL